MVEEGEERTEAGAGGEHHDEVRGVEREGEVEATRDADEDLGLKGPLAAAAAVTTSQRGLDGLPVK